MMAKTSPGDDNTADVVQPADGRRQRCSCCCSCRCCRTPKSTWCNAVRPLHTFCCFTTEVAMTIALASSFAVTSRLPASFASFASFVLRIWNIFSAAVYIGSIKSAGRISLRRFIATDGDVRYLVSVFVLVYCVWDLGFVLCVVASLGFCVQNRLNGLRSGLAEGSWSPTHTALDVDPGSPPKARGWESAFDAITWASCSDNQRTNG